jgi:hypothetical protein
LPHLVGEAGVQLPTDIARHPFDLRWWMREQHGFLLTDVRELPFAPLRGMLNFWPVAADIVAKLGLPPTPEEWRP